MPKETITKPVNPKPEATIDILQLSLIDPPPRNTRGKIEPQSLAGLTQSVRENGVLQAILVRPIRKAGRIRYEIIAGERRYRAAQAARLKEIPAQVKELDDNAALGAQIIENLQREDVHPLDEADGLLRLKEEAKLEISEIGQRIGKDASFVSRRLALTNLIKEARQDYKKGLITLSHALELCRYAPEVQKEALAACYETKTIWQREGETYTYLPDKERPALHVKYLQEWLIKNVYLNLHKAPFKMDDARLRSDGLTCVACPSRSGHDQLLFADIKETDTCLNRHCFQAKLEAHLKLKKAELTEKQGRPAMYISSVYSPSRESKASLARGDFSLLLKKADHCSNAEQAIFVDGPEVGQARWICRDSSCKEHLGKIHDHFSAYHRTSTSSSPAERNQRKQEIFDLKVDEAVRQRVMTEALKTFSWPLDRQQLNQIAKEFLRRIPNDHTKTILSVFGWTDHETSKVRYDEGLALREITKLDDDRLAQLLMLCSFAHFGANPAAHKPVDQKPIVQLAQERQVNHGLIDAQVRAELSPKKYQADHQEYLEALTKGEAMERPVVYERPQKPTLNLTAEEAPTPSKEPKTVKKPAPSSKRKAARKGSRKERSADATRN